MTDQIVSRRRRRDDAAPRVLPVLVLDVVFVVVVVVFVVVVVVVVVFVVDETVLRMGLVLSCNTKTRKTTGYSRHAFASRAIPRGDAAGIPARVPCDINCQREREREREEGEFVFPVSSRRVARICVAMLANVKFPPADRAIRHPSLASLSVRGERRTFVSSLITRFSSFAIRRC
jgi:hypothetical protein